MKDIFLKLMFSILKNYINFNKAIFGKILENARKKAWRKKPH